MRILGIETSCDETAIAIIDARGRLPRPRLQVLANIVASQVKLHAKFGGVVPHLAKHEHQKNLVPVLMTALREAGELKPKTKDQKPKTKNQKSLSPIFYALSAILERESDLFARMVEYVLLRPKPKIDAIAVTVGPGLAPALWVGVNFARALAYLWGKPIIPINHLEGHIFTNLLPQIGEGRRKKEKGQSSPHPNTYHLTPITFPALCLIVSGGHTELVLMQNYGQYRVIGETLDDAAGEAFDKVAKMLGLGFPGGPEIAAEAAKFKTCSKRNQGVQNSPASPELGRGRAKFKISFPRPMMNSQDYSFSFSGLKTAVLYTLRDLLRKHSIRAVRREVAFEFEQAVVDVLVAKTVHAARQYRVKTVMIGGGVAANKKLREELASSIKHLTPIPYTLFPNPSLTSDNALMIALAGWFSRNKKTAWNAVQADANLKLG